MPFWKFEQTQNNGGHEDTQINEKYLWFYTGGSTLRRSGGVGALLMDSVVFMVYAVFQPNSLLGCKLTSIIEEPERNI